MQTTNDMPIVYPPNFKTLGILPFDLNAHFLDADLQSKHMGETRDIRIKSFMLTTLPVLGLREGSWLKVDGDQIIVKGESQPDFSNKIRSLKSLEPDISYVK
jgi:dipeptidase E